MQGAALVIDETVLTHEVARHEIGSRHAANQAVDASPAPKPIGIKAATGSGSEPDRKTHEAARRGRATVADPDGLPLRTVRAALEICDINKTLGRVLQAVRLQFPQAFDLEPCPKRQQENEGDHIARRQVEATMRLLTTQIPAPRAPVIAGALTHFVDERALRPYPAVPVDCLNE